jgi:RND family efflux transporter MFP subunit
MGGCAAGRKPRKRISVNQSSSIEDTQISWEEKGKKAVFLLKSVKNNSRTQQPMNKKKYKIYKLLLPIALILAGMLGYITLTASKTPPQRRKPEVPLPAVQVMKVRIDAQPIIIRGQGTVRPSKQIQLIPQVSGKVIYTSPALVDGGTFAKDDVLLRIESVDYELAVTLAESQVKDAESRLKLSQEEAAVAKEEWREHYRTDDLGGEREPPPLVIKEPQLKAAEARLEADRANLKKARLNLDRTIIRAPFSGVVSGKNVDAGQYVTPGQSLATLFSTESVEIMVPLEDDDLFWFHVPGLTSGKEDVTPAVVYAEIAGRSLSWKGEVVRAEGKIDERTRMIGVIVRVADPYKKKPPLAVGLFARVEIHGQMLEKAALLPRSAMYTDDSIWVVTEDHRLDYRKVNVARFSGDTAFIQDGLKDGEWVVISQMETPTDGMNVRVLDEKEGSAS